MRKPSHANAHNKLTGGCWGEQEGRRKEELLLLLELPHTGAEGGRRRGRRHDTRARAMQAAEHAEEAAGVLLGWVRGEGCDACAAHVARRWPPVTGRQSRRLRVRRLLVVCVRACQIQRTVWRPPCSTRAAHTAARHSSRPPEPQSVVERTRVQRHPSSSAAAAGAAEVGAQPPS
jgi:hypothetical protein